MTQYYYLLALVVSICGLATIDRRFKLAFWHDKKRTFKLLLTAIIFFIGWDLLGIAFNIFFHGGSSYGLGLRLLPEMPLEELFFLFLLNYTTLLLYLGGLRLWSRT